jgi:hypothetical protein
MVRLVTSRLFKYSWVLYELEAEHERYHRFLKIKFILINGLEKMRPKAWCAAWAVSNYFRRIAGNTVFLADEI